MLDRRKYYGVDLGAAESFCDDDESPKTKRKLVKRGEKEETEEFSRFGGPCAKEILQK